MIQAIGKPERRIKWMQLQRGNNGGHGVWCSYSGQKKNLAEAIWINHTLVAMNLNEDTFCCFFICGSFNKVLASSFVIHGSSSILRFIILLILLWHNVVLTERNKIIWNVMAAVCFPSVFSVLHLRFCCDKRAPRSNRSLSSDITCQSRQEKCSLKVTSLWCLYTQRATTAFISCELKFTTYALTARRKHL